MYDTCVFDNNWRPKEKNTDSFTSFSAVKAALGMQMSVSLSVCLSVRHAYVFKAKMDQTNIIHATYVYLDENSTHLKYS